ncbi:hypothetical protein PRK78_001615 [Emydomyces testavorans]|uniref:Uncharacterized protein n=1 Tax=Emydomyces testavorans TaxID=2070801 RepID=A0AAF0DD71_9EURO|nr:hypothetical protein PRK78_001615 [Emydomyces testavorans]
MTPRDEDRISTTAVEVVTSGGSPERSEVGTDDALLESLGYKPQRKPRNGGKVHLRIRMSRSFIERTPC